MHDWRCAFVHVPMPEVGDMLIEDIENIIQKYGRKRIGACWWIAVFVSASACIRASICVCLYTLTGCESACVRELSSGLALM